MAQCRKEREPTRREADKAMGDDASRTGVRDTSLAVLALTGFSLCQRQPQRVSASSGPTHRRGTKKASTAASGA